jgi:hypothetical protein
MLSQQQNGSQMTKHLLAGVAAAVWLSGAASAQPYPPAPPPPLPPDAVVVPAPPPVSVPGPSTTTTTTVAPSPDGNVHWAKSWIFIHTNLPCDYFAL